MRVLALDAGSVNFGYVGFDTGVATPRIIQCGMLNSPLKILTGDNILDDFLLYRKEIGRLITQLDPDLLAAERYTTRIRGTTTEAVNMMLGAAADILMRFNKQQKRDPPATMKVVMAANWKVPVKKRLDLDALYKSVGVPDHVVDATFMGLHCSPTNWNRLSVNSLLRQLQRTYIDGA